MNAVTKEMQQAQRPPYIGSNIPEFRSFNMPDSNQLRVANTSPDAGAIDPNLDKRLAIAANAKSPADLMQDPMFLDALKDPAKRAILANNANYQTLLPKIESLLEAQAKAGVTGADQTLGFVKETKLPEKTADGAGFQPQPEQRTRPQLAAPTRS